MEKKNLISLIVIGVVFFIVGGGLGLMYQKQKDAQSQLPQNNKKVAAVQTLSSKVIPSITAYGQISKIDGRNLTLAFGGDSLTIKIRDDALVYMPSKTTSDSSGKQIITPQTQSKFSDIKTGDNVSVNVKLLSDGQLEGQIVIILQSAKK